MQEKKFNNFGIKSQLFGFFGFFVFFGFFSESIFKSFQGFEKLNAKGCFLLQGTHTLTKKAHRSSGWNQQTTAMLKLLCGAQ